MAVDSADDLVSAGKNLDNGLDQTKQAGKLADDAASAATDNLNAPKSGKGFFEGTSYTDKVKAQMKQGDYHSFPESATAFDDAGKVKPLTGGDGVVREMLEIPGSYKGKDGVFQFIRETDGSINHRLFVPNPAPGG